MTWRQVVGGLFILAALLVAWPKPPAGPSVAWVPYNEAALAQARQDGTPAVVDVYADWCLPCVEMDHATFHHPDVVQALGSVVALRVDATREISPEAQKLLGRYQVYGAPTILFFDRRGAERKELRALGFVNPEEFLERLKRLL